MSHGQISNSEFLEMFIGRSERLPSHVLLPHEGRAVDNAVAAQDRAYNQILEEKIAVTGGDDWHDGAFRETDREANTISRQMSAIAPFIGALIVDYPHENEFRVTLGSRIAVTQNGYTFPVDIVGFRAGYPENIKVPEYDDELIGMSPDSPLAQTILGKEAGFETTFYNGDKEMYVVINKIDQIAIRDYFMRDVQVFRIAD